MSSIQLQPVRRARLAALAVLALACAAPIAVVHAQSAPQPAPSGPDPQERAQERAEGRKNQKIEHIHVEDGGASVDELRVGGRTQSITVQPKAKVPAYEVRPSGEGNGTDRQGPAETGTNGNGPRVWNVMKF